MCSRAFVFALECLQKSLLEGVKQCLIGASNYKVVDVYTKFNTVAQPKALLGRETHSFAAFSGSRKVLITVCHVQAADGIL